MFFMNSAGGNDVVDDFIYQTIDAMEQSNQLNGNIHVSDIVRQIQDAVLERGREYSRLFHYSSRKFVYGIDEKGQPTDELEEENEELEYFTEVEDEIVREQIYETVERE